ncbi:MAG: conjugal transfer protein TraG N-terminal domain-containing protein [Alphaproteobacteria bacterium]|nr:conjugal transfer protein TraG N-terminal domain-containing protein [Alphaproteobacteria bacterium]
MWTITTTGDAAFLADVLNGLALLGSAGTLAGLAKVGAIGGVIAISMKGLFAGRLDLQGAVIGLVLYMLAFGQTTTVVVQDGVSGRAYPVANVPLGAAVAGAGISSIGRSLTERFEQAFSVPSSTGSGLADALWVLRTVRERSRSVEGLGPARYAGGGDLVRGWAQYIRECTFKSLWLKSKSESTFRAAAWADAMRYSTATFWTRPEVDAASGALATCADAFPALEAHTRGTVLPAFYRQLDQVIGRDGESAENRIGDALEAVGLSAIGPADFVLSGLIESIHHESVSQENFMLGRDDFALVDALRQRAEKWSAEGAIFETWARPFMTFTEGFIFAITPFTAFLVVLGAAGIGMVSKYLLLLVWLQLWLPAMAVVNLFVYKQMILLTANATAAGTVWSSLDGVLVLDSILLQGTAWAGNLAASVPALTLTIVYGGAVATTHLLGHFQGQNQFDPKRVAPDSGNAIPVIQRAGGSAGEWDSARGLHQGEWASKLVAHGESTGGVRVESARTASMDAQQAFARDLSSRIASSNVASTASEMASHFRTGDTSTFSHGERALMQRARGVTESVLGAGHQSENEARSVLAAIGASAGLSASAGGPGKGGAGVAGPHIGGQLSGELGKKLDSLVGVDKSRQLQAEMARQWSGGEEHAAGFVESVAADVAHGRQNAFSSALSKEDSQSLTASASEVVRTGQQYSRALSAGASEGAGMAVDLMSVAHAVGQRPELAAELQRSLARTGLGGEAVAEGPGFERHFGARPGQGWIMAGLAMMSGIVPPRGTTMDPVASADARSEFWALSRAAVGLAPGAAGVGAGAAEAAGVGTGAPAAGSIRDLVAGATGAAAALPPAGAVGAAVAAGHAGIENGTAQAPEIKGPLGKPAAYEAIDHYVGGKMSVQNTNRLWDAEADRAASAAEGKIDQDLARAQAVNRPGAPPLETVARSAGRAPKLVPPYVRTVE